MSIKISILFTIFFHFDKFQKVHYYLPTKNDKFEPTTETGKKMKKLTRTTAYMICAMFPKFTFASEVSTNSNSNSSYSFSLNAIDRFFETMPDWVILAMFCIVLASVSISLCYAIYATSLKFVERLVSFKTKVAAEKKARNDMRYGKEVVDTIKKAFEDPDLKLSHNPEVSLETHRAWRRLELFIEIIEASERNLGLDRFELADQEEENHIVRHYISVQEEINNFINNLRTSLMTVHTKVE